MNQPFVAFPPFRALAPVLSWLVGTATVGIAISRGFPGGVGWAISAAPFYWLGWRHWRMQVFVANGRFRVHNLLRSWDDSIDAVAEIVVSPTDPAGHTVKLKLKDGAEFPCSALAGHLLMTPRREQRFWDQAGQFHEALGQAMASDSRRQVGAVTRRHKSSRVTLGLSALVVALWIGLGAPPRLLPLLGFLLIGHLLASRR